MRMLGVFSPPIVLVLWAAEVVLFGRSDLSVTIGLLACAASMLLHIFLVYVRR